MSVNFGKYDAIKEPTTAPSMNDNITPNVQRPRCLASLSPVLLYEHRASVPLLKFPVWETNTYNVTLDARGGIFKSDSSHTVRFSRKYGEAIGRLPAADEVYREAYEFAGWSREANDQGQDVNEHAAVKGDRECFL